MFIRERAKFEVKHKNRCFQKSKLFDWGPKHVNWGTKPHSGPLVAGFVKILVFVQDGLEGAMAPVPPTPNPSWTKTMYVCIAYVCLYCVRQIRYNFLRVKLLVDYKTE